MKKPFFSKINEEKICIYLGITCFILLILPTNNKEPYADLAIHITKYLLILKTILLIWVIVIFRVAFLIFKQHLFIKNTPTSKLNSAAQGYVNVQGTALELTDKPLLSPISQTPCVWYNYKIKNKVNINDISNGSIIFFIMIIIKSKENIEEDKSSNQEFILVDSNGECIIDPDDANIITTVTNTWYSNNLYKEEKFYNIFNNTNKDIKQYNNSECEKNSLFNNQHKYAYEYEENLLLPKQQVYVSGFFRSISSIKIADQENNKNQEILNLLATWKKDYQTLLEKFDTNKNGKIDPDEWEKIVKEAEKQINLKYYNKPLQSSTINVISKQGLLFDQPFIISVDNKLNIAKKLNIKFITYIMLFIFATLLILTLDYWYADFIVFFIKVAK